MTRPSWFFAGLLIVILGLFCVNRIPAQDMIADITEDVETEFGTYHPFLVEIEPAAEPYTVEPDFSNVVNFSDFGFTAVEESLLSAHYFVVSPTRHDGGSGYKEIYDIYNECREQDVPIFVTTDAMLHTFHLLFDRILKTIETKRLFVDLQGLLGALFFETLNQYGAAQDASVRAALERNIDYLIVAASLLDSTYDAGSYGIVYQDELDLIAQHAGFETSPIFMYDEDYSQYIPRGHYTDSDSLRHYFLSMMWLGRMTFDAEAPEPTRSAVLLVQALDKAAANIIPALALWERIYLPTVFFVGKSDDINFYQYKELAVQVYGSDFANLVPDDFADEAKLEAFLELAEDLPEPGITYPGQPSKGYRLMGQRFIPDSYVLDHMVMPYTGRMMPKGLDVMSVLGSARAWQILDEVYHDLAADQLMNLKAEFEAYPDSVWAQNVYWNWLYSLMPLLFEKGQGFPPFMQNQAWTDKELNDALGSWAELRHDTILYAKQGGWESVPPYSGLVQGYVEPNPYFYARLASLDDLMITGLEDQGLLFPRFEPSLTSLKELLLTLKTISEKELTNQSLTFDEYEVICNIGETIETIVEFETWTEGPGPNNEEMPVIADVHTDPLSGTCLEEGVGYPMNIYVICDVEGELRLTRGAVFSYYEFEWPLNDRLTDEKWIELLQGEDPPAPPIWTASFLDYSTNWGNPDPRFYYWQKQGLVGVVATVEGEEFTVGDMVSIRIRSSSPFAESPAVAIFPSTGDPFSLTDIQSEGDDFLAYLNTSGMSPGEVGVYVTAEVGQYETTTISYRTKFLLHPGVDIKGDVSGDGQIDIQDVVLTVNIVLNTLEPTPEQFWAADWNDDEGIDILDVVGLIRFILGIGDRTFVDFEDVEDYGNFCVIPKGTAVITSDSEWTNLWELYWNVTDGYGNKTPPAEIDFDEAMVIGVFWGGGCIYSGCTNRSPSIGSVWIASDTLRVSVGEMEDLGPCDACVCPLHLIKTQKLNLPIQFTGEVP
ncbi:MAG: DUF3160 domain-containing protein [Gemmatimonadota bacterium]|nr:MAG: DUF3160 domain-containing protein [Gemmatimonadota bacterium]